MFDFTCCVVRVCHSLLTYLRILVFCCPIFLHENVCNVFATVQLNGISTLGENIADNGGLKISYDALQTWLDEHHHNDALLPGLNMTHSQQFFLSFAQVCCIKFCNNGMILLVRNVTSFVANFLRPLMNSERTMLKLAKSWQSHD